MSQPYTPPPTTVSYLVRINSGEWTEYKTAANCSKFVADNICYGNSAYVEFKNATNVVLVRWNFNGRIDEWLRQLGHTGGFWCGESESGAHYRLTE